VIKTHVIFFCKKTLESFTRGKVFTKVFFRKQWQTVVVYKQIGLSYGLCSLWIPSPKWPVMCRTGRKILRTNCEPIRVHRLWKLFRRMQMVLSCKSLYFWNQETFKRWHCAGKFAFESYFEASFERNLYCYHRNWCFIVVKWPNIGRWHGYIYYSLFSLRLCGRIIFRSDAGEKWLSQLVYKKLLWLISIIDDLKQCFAPRYRVVTPNRARTTFFFTEMFVYFGCSPN